eukprot:Awhi_evm1s5923
MGPASFPVTTRRSSKTSTSGTGTPLFPDESFIPLSTPPKKTSKKRGKAKVGPLNVDPIHNGSDGTSGTKDDSFKTNINVNIETLFSKDGKSSDIHGGDKKVNVKSECLDKNITTEASEFKENVKKNNNRGGRKSINSGASKTTVPNAVSSSSSSLSTTTTTTTSIPEAPSTATIPKSSSLPKTSTLPTPPSANAPSTSVKVTSTFNGIHNNSNANNTMTTTTTTRTATPASAPTIDANDIQDNTNSSNSNIDNNNDVGPYSTSASFIDVFINQFAAAQRANIGLFLSMKDVILKDNVPIDPPRLRQLQLLEDQ